MPTADPAKPIIHFVSSIRGPGATNWFRQTPAGDGRWQQAQFVLADEDMTADWLVVFDDLLAPLQTLVPWSRCIVSLVRAANPEALRAALSQPVRHGRRSCAGWAGIQGRVVIQQPALPWYCGVSWRTHVGLGGLGAPPCENPAHIGRRLRQGLAAAIQGGPLFVDKLKEALGDELDVFGRGVRPIDDKAEAIGPYRYHVVLENNTIDHFWTEKLADAYLGEAFPIYSGGGQLARYFDPQSFATIDVSDPDRAVADVVKLLADDPAARVQPLLQARMSHR